MRLRAAVDTDIDIDGQASVSRRRTVQKRAHETPSTGGEPSHLDNRLLVVSASSLLVQAEGKVLKKNSIECAELYEPGSKG